MTPLPIEGRIKRITSRPKGRRRLVIETLDDPIVIDLPDASGMGIGAVVEIVISRALGEDEIR